MDSNKKVLILKDALFLMRDRVDLSICEVLLFSIDRDERSDIDNVLDEFKIGSTMYRAYMKYKKDGGYWYEFDNKGRESRVKLLHASIDKFKKHL